MSFVKISETLIFLCCFTFGQNNMIICKCKAGTFSEDSQVSISLDKKSPMEVLGASKIEAALQRLSLTPQVVDKSIATGQEQIKVNVVSPTEDAEIRKEGFRISKTGGTYTVTAIDNAGAMYGLMDLAEQIQMQKGLSNYLKREVLADNHL